MKKNDHYCCNFKGWERGRPWDLINIKWRTKLQRELMSIGNVLEGGKEETTKFLWCLPLIWGSLKQDDAATWDRCRRLPWSREWCMLSQTSSWVGSRLLGRPSLIHPLREKKGSMSMTKHRAKKKSSSKLEKDLGQVNLKSFGFGNWNHRSLSDSNGLETIGMICLTLDLIHYTMYEWVASHVATLWTIQSHKHCKAPSKLRLWTSLELTCQMKWSGLGKLKALVILEIEITKVAFHVEFKTTKVLGLYLRINIPMVFKLKQKIYICQNLSVQNLLRYPAVTHKFRGGICRQWNFN